MHIILEERIRAVVKSIIVYQNESIKEMSKKIEDQVIAIMNNADADRTPDNIMNVTFDIIDKLLEG